MSQKATLMSILLLLFSLPFLQAQSTLEIQRAQFIIQSNNLSGVAQFSEEQLEDMEQTVLDSIFANTSHSITVSINVSDTTTIQTIYVRIGRTQGGVDIANVSVPYIGALPSAVLALQKDSGEIQLEFGQFTNIETLYLEVWMDDTNGQTTPVYQTSNQ